MCRVFFPIFPEDRETRGVNDSCALGSDTIRAVTVRGWIFVGAALLVPVTAHAETQAEHCVRASDEGQTSRQHGKLLDAQKSFIACAAVTCPKLVRADCERWLDEVNRDLPSIVLGVKDSKGDVLDARVIIDGGDPKRPDGSPVPLDPGTHVVRFERKGASSIERTLVVRTGERNRSVVETMELAGAPDSKPIPTTSSSSGGIPTVSWVLGGVGVAGLASFATFGLIGLSQKSDLNAKCSPACTDEDISKLRSSYIVADVSLAIGVVAAGLAVYFALTNDPAKTSSRRALFVW